MSLVIAPLAALVVQGTGSFPDTIITKQLPVGPGWFATIVGIAQIMTTLAMLVLVLALVPVAISLARNWKRIDQILVHLHHDLQPLVRNANAAAENVSAAAVTVNHIATATSTTIDQVNDTVRMANERLSHAIVGAEQRVRELNSLVGLVQHEAEGVFVVTASALRGIRAGAHALRGRALFEVLRRAAANRRTAGADDDGDADDAGSDDGGDVAAESPAVSRAAAAAAPAERPRVRRRG